MSSRRMERAAEAIRETVSTTVLFGLRDPRVKNVTVLGAEVTSDLRGAKIFVTIMGDAKAQSLAMHGLNSAKGFIQAKGQKSGNINSGHRQFCTGLIGSGH